MARRYLGVRRCLEMRGYPPLWLVIVYYNADWPAVDNLDSALKAKVLAEGGASQLPDRFYRALER